MPLRDVALPSLPENVLSVVGSTAGPVAVKQNVRAANSSYFLPKWVGSRPFCSSV